MKNIYTYLALSLVLLSSCSSSRDFAQSYTPESQDITYQQFYDGLSPYGNWVNYQDYGYVWVPDEQGFRPYYNNGHWVYTNYGWTWVSGYDWGWAPFHYGRWLYDDAYGWMWTPGYEWAPAWVSWRSGNGCYGWAPLGPGNNFDMGMSSRIPDNYWAFVPNRYINSPRINNYYINREKNVTIINNTTVINNTTIVNNNNAPTRKIVYVAGPSAPDVEKVTNEKIRPAKVVQQNTPGSTKVSGSVVSIYRPGIKQMPQENNQLKPSKIINLNELQKRRQNAGEVKNEMPAREAQENTVPVNSITRPVLNPQKNNNVPVINGNSNPTVEKPVQSQQPRVQINHPQVPVQQKPVETQQPPVQTQPQVRDHLPRVPARAGEIEQPQVQPQQPRTLPAQQNQPEVEQQPVVTPNQPSKIRAINQRRVNSENAQQNPNAPATPVNRQPVRNEQPDIVRPQHFPINKQPDIAPVNRSPVIRDQSTAEPREIRREAPQRERK